MVVQEMKKLGERSLGNGEQRTGKPKRFDVTSTLAYKELYANNLRMYSFLMKKELDRRSQQRLQDRKEDYFQNHVTTQNNQRNNRLLKSFKQMSRMRTCLSDLDLSRTSDSESEGSQENLSCTPLERQDRKQSLLDVRRHDYDDVNVVSRPRAKTTLGNYNVSAYLNSKKDLDSTTKKYLRVPSAAEKPVSPLASPTSSINFVVTSPSSPTSPPRSRYMTLNRRHYSDLGSLRSSELEVSSDSDVTYSDSELHIGESDNAIDEKRSRSPSFNRARQARIRQEYRKARLASLEGTISKANSILKDIRKSSLPRKIPEDETKTTTETEIKYSSLPRDLAKF